MRVGFGGVVCRALAAGFVLQAVGDVLLGGDLQVDGLALDAAGVEVLEERDAPLAAGAGAKAFADERGDGGFFAEEVAADLAE